MAHHFKSRLLCASALAAVLVCTVPAEAAGTDATLTGHVPGWVNTAARTGTAPDRQRVSIAVHMALKDQAGLKALAAEVSRPGSAAYGHYLGKAEFQRRFAPDTADVAAVEKLLTQAGMANLVRGPGGAFVTADATVGQLRRTFGVTQDLYRFGATSMRSNREAPAIPAKLAGKVLFIEGLDDTTLLKKPQRVSATEGDRLAPATFKTDAARGTAATDSVQMQTAQGTARKTAVSAPVVTPPPVAANLPSAYCDDYYGDLKATLSTKPGVYPKTLPWLICGYTPAQVRAAYGFDKTKLDGTGVTIAILDAYASPTLKADGNAYAKNHGLPPLTADNFSMIIPKGIYSVSPDEECQPYGWWGEQSLDLAAVHASAPGAAIVYIGSRDCGTSLSVALLNAIYNQQADIITNSYSYNGEALAASDIAAQDQAFMAAAAMGITLLFSSGDDGDLSQLNGVASGSFESTSPYVTSVGGTTLGVRNAKGAKGEWGWGTYRANLDGVKVESGTAITTTGVNQTTVGDTTFDNYTFYAGAGGGISIVEPQPDYQVPVVPAALATSLNLASGYTVPLTPRRVTPDISMVADPYTGVLYGETFTIAGDAGNDAGCTKLTKTTEYCEVPIGGTSLSSPLMAGVIAVVNQARNNAGKPLVGFANPWLYGHPIGSSFTAAGVNAVLPPASPIALLRGYYNDLARVRVITINSVPFNIQTAPFALQVCSLPICQGVNDVFNYTTAGYDDVTGLGVPYVPALIKQ